MSWHYGFAIHYENTPIQIYWEFYPRPTPVPHKKKKKKKKKKKEKKENFPTKISDSFHILLKTEIVGTR